MLQTHDSFIAGVDGNYELVERKHSKARAAVSEFSMDGRSVVKASGRHCIRMAERADGVCEDAVACMGEGDFLVGGLAGEIGFVRS